MRVPVSWLKEYVAWDGSVEELAELLTMSGTEVEGIDWAGAPHDAANLSRFVVGRVATKEKHPNADKLSLCTVDVGAANGGLRQIVCGAHNFAAGDTVAVSLSGAVLENGLKLKKANLRGVESDGMMMSEAELGFEEKSPGIVVLPGDWTVGAPLQQYLPVSEAVLELEITPNRPDCFSIYGIAREVAAAGGVELKAPPVAEPATVGGAPAEQDIAVEVRDPELCPRYAARVIRGVEVAPSPPWLKARLTHAGMRPISNVVDVTNYTMLAWGQPLHAFDAGKIGGHRLVVRRASEGERIVTLDGVERTLEGDMLVIADVERPLVIAGVFGSVDAEVDERTTDIVLESATFSGPSIMRTERVSGIRSEASNRFEKGLDTELVPGGLAMASRLFAELCGGTVAPGVVDVRAQAPARRAIAYRPSRCDALLGYEVEAPRQAELLRRLECEVAEPPAAAASATAEWTVIPPSFRPDLEREVDLIEEVGRLVGYDVAPKTLPRGATHGALTRPQKVARTLARTLTACSLDEVITYTFIAPDALAPLGLPESDARLAPVRISNPMSGEQEVMRTSLLPGLIATVRDNVARLNEPPNLFELGRVYLWDEQSTTAPAHTGSPAGARLPHEAESLGIILSGPMQAEAWTGAGRPTDFYTLKGVVEAALRDLRVEACFAPLGDAAALYPHLHPGKSARIGVRSGADIGVAGLLRPDVAAACGVEDLELYVASLRLDRLAEVALPTVVFEDLVTYPPASQDLAVVIDRAVSADELLATARKAGGKLTYDIRVFDVYEGDQVPEGKRSLALRVSMRSPERTLSDKDIAGVRAKILKALQREYGAELR